MEFRKKLHVLRCNVYMVEQRGGKSKQFEEDLKGL
jgi:hypothetical protein